MVCVVGYLEPNIFMVADIEFSAVFPYYKLIFPLHPPLSILSPSPHTAKLTRPLVIEGYCCLQKADNGEGIMILRLSSSENKNKNLYCQLYWLVIWLSLMESVIWMVLVSYCRNPVCKYVFVIHWCTGKWQDMKYFWSHSVLGGVMILVYHLNVCSVWQTYC